MSVLKFLMGIFAFASILLWTYCWYIGEIPGWLTFLVWIIMVVAVMLIKKID